MKGRPSSRCPAADACTISGRSLVLDWRDMVKMQRYIAEILQRYITEILQRYGAEISVAGNHDSVKPTRQGIGRESEAGKPTEIAS